MALNFPDSPTNGATTTLNGVTYTYNSTSNKWKATTSSSSGGTGGGSTTVYATVSELPLTGNTAGEQAYVTATNRLYLWTGSGWYNIALINTAPTITSGGAGSYVLATDGTPTVITLAAADPEEVPITWTYAVTSGSLTNGGGATATVSQADNVFTITPTTTSAYQGEFSLTFTASDGVNIATDVNLFTLTFQSASWADTIFSLGTSSGSTTPTGSYRYLKTILHSTTGGGTQAQVTEVSFTGTAGSTDYITGQILTNWSGTGTTATSQSPTVSLTNNSQSPSNSEHTNLETLPFTLETDLGTAQEYGTALKYLQLGSSDDANRYPNRVSVYGATQSDFSDEVLLIDNVATASPGTNSMLLVDLTLRTGANDTFQDESTNALTLTHHTAPTLSSFNPFYNNWSVKFDGTTDLLDVSGANGEFDITSSFSAEAWFYMTEAAGTGPDAHAILTHWADATDPRPWLIDIDGTSVRVLVNNSSNTQIVNQTLGTVSLNKWHHVALTWDGSNYRVFLDGVALSTTASSDAPIASTRSVRIGYNTNNHYFPGYISNVRITIDNGAQYTSNFTPPTEMLSAITGTVLLTAQSNRIIDNSNSNLTIALTGNPSVESFNPFGQSTEFDSGINWGSGYFITAGSTANSGGSGQYVQSDLSSGLTLDTNDFTISCWVYGMGKTRNYPRILQIGPQNSPWGSSQLAILYKHNDDSDSICLAMHGIGVNAMLIASGPIYDKQWYHVAVTRSGTTFTMYINGESVGTYTSAGSATGTGDKAILIGSSSAGDSDFSGYISDVRVINGTDVYGGNFTVPSEPAGNTNAEVYVTFDNIGVFDKTGNNRNLDLRGDAIFSNQLTKYETSALSLDGQSDYVQVGGISSTNVWTVETWFNSTRYYSGSGHFDRIWSHGISLANSLVVNLSSSNGAPVYRINDSVTLTSASGINLNTWHHLALVCDGTNTTMYLDGAVVSTISSAVAMPFRAFRIGTLDGTQGFFSGSIEGFQIITDFAKYTTAFTPPSSPQGITYQKTS